MDAYEQLLLKIQAGLAQKMSGQQDTAEEESLRFPGQSLEEANKQQQQYEEQKQKQQKHRLQQEQLERQKQQQLKDEKLQQIQMEQLRKQQLDKEEQQRAKQQRLKEQQQKQQEEQQKKQQEQPQKQQEELHYQELQQEQQELEQKQEQKHQEPLAQHQHPEMPQPPDPGISGCRTDTSFKGLYDEICNRIRVTGVLDSIMKEFQELKTDLERVQYVAQMNEVQNFRIQENYAKKNAEDANNYEKVYDMLAPNEASANKALDVIKKCLMKTPAEDKTAMAIRYMKRGWAYLLLEQFDNAKEDALKSLTFECPGELIWNSYEILGHCSARQKHYKDAEVQFLKALENLRKSNVPNDVKATTTVRIMSVFKTVKGKKQKEGQNSPVEKSTKKKLPQLSYGVNKRFINASAAIDFLKSPTVGRCGIAQRDIKPGDILIVDAPYATMMNVEATSSHCYNCFYRCPCPVPCVSCAKVMFCSESCRKTSWSKTHRHECKILNHLMDPDIGKVALLVFRTLTTVSWASLQKLKEKIMAVIDAERNKISESAKADESSTVDEADKDSKALPLAWQGKYSPQEYKTVLHLVTNSDKRSFGDLFKRSITALYISQCLKIGGFFGKQEPDEDDILFVASLALRHLQGASCNAYEISEYDGTTSDINEIGGAFYTTISLTNHSCKSNAIRYSVGDHCVLSAIRYIPKGTEVFDNYGFQYYGESVAERQEVLQNQYKFNCLCEACVSNWPLYPHHQMETLTFRCPSQKCQATFCYSTSVRSKCNMCGNSQQFAKLVKELEAQMEHFKDCMAALKKGNTAAALAGLLSHQMFLDLHVVEPCKHYTDVIAMIKNCHSRMGNIYLPYEPVPLAEPTKPKGQKLRASKTKYVQPR